MGTYFRTCSVLCPCHRPIGENMHYTLKEQVELLKESVSDLKAINQVLKDQLFETNKKIVTINQNLKKAVDEYSMLMSKLRPLVKEVAKLDR